MVDLARGVFGDECELAEQDVDTGVLGVELGVWAGCEPVLARGGEEGWGVEIG